ncbi:MAG: TraB/GumN family protein [Prevotella sp.]|nr:TraB/GumN family protein [Prevotella sp.]
MKRITTFMFLMAMVAIGAQAQLLYKISGNGLTAPSYIIGTYHVAPVSFVDSISGIRQVLADVEQVYGELDMTDLLSGDNMQKMQAAMMLPEGTTLTSLLSENETSRLNARLREVMGVDMTNPMVAQQLNQLSPMTLSTQLSLLNFMKKTPGFDPTNLFDSYFQKVATEQGKGVGGLESLEFQIKMLYQGKSLERQKELLMCQVDNWDFMEQMTDNVIKAFFNQDLNAIKEAMDMKMDSSCDSTPEEEAQLIDDRNANWLQQMPAIMQAKPTLFAVGAGHLPGDKGVLHLLKTAGYSVEGVK